jgi:ATP-dependent RNA/DNA helicase IGHMBP2
MLKPIESLKIEDERPKQNEYIEKVKNEFNDEQVNVLRSIATMAPHDFRTVWGPPGTGKTQVLNAIIAMAISGGLKIQVCAPSNAAIDEILTRINAKGLIGLQIKKDIQRKVDSKLTQ